MAAYVIADILVTDPVEYEEYRKQAGEALKAFDGRFLARGGDAVHLEGDWEPRRVVILEFGDLARAKAWWASTEYAPARAIRERTAETRMVAVEGV